MATKNTIRLNKFIANSGLCSRREADMHIGLGTVKVNGEKSLQKWAIKFNQETK